MLPVPVSCSLAIWTFTVRKEEAGAPAVLREELAYAARSRTAISETGFSDPLFLSSTLDQLWLRGEKIHMMRLHHREHECSRREERMWPHLV